jgi:hypothetical protein
MAVPSNRFKSALNELQQIGLWSTLSSNLLIELFAGCGFDWILLDTEHSRCAMREFLYGPRKSEFGDSLVKVLFLERTSPEKSDRTFVFSVSNFFQELLDWQVTD